MLDIQSISIVIAATSVVVGVIFAILQLRNAMKQRRTEILMSLYSRLGSAEFANALERIRTSEYKDYHEYVKKYGVAELYQVGSVFEGLGFLMHRKLVDKDLASLFSSSESLITWEKIRPMVENARKLLSQRRMGEYIPMLVWWEYFYNEVKKREQRLQQTLQ
ncbi:MAG: hypothetical protein JSV51_10100 [Candidatus Bathyarchaeota archaeon]|nr:MAG: hypothetical protein JSV51_10100 [Candidatus Bathyarchaeota archaeon]